MGRLEFAVFTIAIVSGCVFAAIWFSILDLNPIIYPPSETCKIVIQMDLSTPSPLLLRQSMDPNEYGNEAWYLPLYNGVITLDQEDIINLSCPNGTVYLDSNDTELSIVPVKCTGRGRVFEIISTKESTFLSRFICSNLGHTARYTEKVCLNNFKEIEVGFQINETTFLREMTICFDPKEYNTAFSAYNLTNRIGGKQTVDQKQNNFKSKDFYELPESVETLYDKKTLRSNINKQLGLHPDDEEYIKSQETNYFLSRGHLTARADFVYRAQQSATNYYVNVAPQWQSFNGGNWNELEQSVRRLAEDRVLDLEVYTGTHGVMTLPHNKTGEPTPLYLFNEDARKGIAVPEMFWKVVYNPKAKSGIAFVGFNNPYKKNTSKDLLCEDICYKVKFHLSWDRLNVQKGLGYCCEVNQLRGNITNIPKLDVNDILV